MFERLNHLAGSGMYIPTKILILMPWFIYECSLLKASVDVDEEECFFLLIGKVFDDNISWC